MDSNDGGFWILNDQVENAEVSHRELFGFNTGTFQEIPSGELARV